MRYIVKQFKQILLTSAFVLYVGIALSQVKHKPLAKETAIAKPIVAKPMSSQLKDFYHLAAVANVVFTFPAGFREIPVLNDEDFSFDYAIELPGHDFEIWFQVKSQKSDWAEYLQLKNDLSKQLENPDSLYIGMGRAQASSFTGGQDYLTRTIPQDILAKYNANAGKTYLLNLQDLPETKHYKYALLITLQKNHIGTILAICFTNDKGPDFFKNINRVSKCLKFKR
jgi:hypothetical protein